MTTVILQKLIGSTVTIFCHRYIYRGKVKEVAGGIVFLDNAVIVEVVGKDLNPERTLNVPNGACVMIDKIEMVTPNEGKNSLHQ